MRPTPSRFHAFPTLLSALFFFSLPLASFSADAGLAFQPAGDRLFEFNTGRVKGLLRATDKSQGLVSLIDVETGKELAAGPGLPGLFSYYRLFSSAKRWGDAMRDWPKSARLLPDGAVEITWPPLPAHPVELTALFRWSSPNTLDLVTSVKPQLDLPRCEVFLSSYFGKNFRSLVYTTPTLHLRGKPVFLPCDANPFVAGTYMAFPRDRRAAEILFDGRWDFPPNPVHLAVGKFLAAPLALKRDDAGGFTFVLMSRPQDCFSLLTPYNMAEKPDGVAAHYSLYFSLFGYDVKAGQTARAATRLVLARTLSDAEAVALYEQFISQTKVGP